jgi:Fur family transcriptional regulator, peroxide stress response regulator
MKSTKDTIADFLTESNIKPSFQRIKILEYIKDNNSHPTVDEIYKALLKDVPTLSKTTIYNTLTLFIEAKILKGLYIEENEIRYDSILHNHGHFKCKQCEEIYDFSIDIDEFQSNELNTFQIEEKGVYFKGVCPKCIHNNK